MSETRKLAAILCSDVVGYSRLAGVDEDRILARLRALRSDLIDPTIAVHNGRIVKRTGDGAIIEFRSVVDAVRCAIEVQNAMVERNAGVPEDRRIVFRVGIHLGDVVEESDGDLMGDGVNIAARLEGIAEPGAICLSEDAYRQVKGRLDLAITDLGARRLKNIAEPIRAYSLQVGAPAVAKRADSATPEKRTALMPLFLAIAALLILIAGSAGYLLSAQRPATVAWNAPAPAGARHLSIVVLPFANLSGDPAQDYFADGITENLTTALSRLAGSFVIARNTAFTYKGKSVDAKEIGKDLGVRYVLEGSAQRDQNRVRVNAQLVDAVNGNHLWAERFDKPLADLFDMQDEIVGRISNQLGVELIAAEARRARSAPSPDSMDLYFQGLAWYNKSPVLDTMTQARRFFERALELDPNNVNALLGTGQVDAWVGATLTDNRAERLASAEAILSRVLSTAPDSALAHFWMAVVLGQTGRAAQGLIEDERALTLDPNLALAHNHLGVLKLFLGRYEEVEADVREAMRLSPRDNRTFLFLDVIGDAKLHLGDDEAAVGWSRRSIDANPNYALAHMHLASALAHLGRLDEASREAQAGLALDPEFTIKSLRERIAAQNHDAAYLKTSERVIEGMRKAGVPEQ
jgi:adenylate cyclase